MANSALIGFKLDGLDEVRNVLKTLPKELADKVLQTALTRAAAPVVKAAKRNAPVRTGALRQSIGTIVKKGKRDGSVYAVIGPRRGYYRQGKALKKTADNTGADQPANYGHLVEYGHMAVKPDKGATLREKKRNWKKARAVRFIPPKPFLRPALMNSKTEVIAEMAKGVAEGMQRQLKRLQKNPKAIR